MPFQLYISKKFNVLYSSCVLLQGTLTQATVWTAFAMKSSEPMSDTVHVQVGATEPTNIYINGQLEEFDDLADQTFNGE